MVKEPKVVQGLEGLNLAERTSFPAFWSRIEGDYKRQITVEVLATNDQQSVFLVAKNKAGKEFSVTVANKHQAEVTQLFTVGESVDVIVHVMVPNEDITAEDIARVQERYGANAGSKHVAYKASGEQALHYYSVVA